MHPAATQQPTTCSALLVRGNADAPAARTAPIHWGPEQQWMPADAVQVNPAITFDEPAAHAFE